MENELNYYILSKSQNSSNQYIKDISSLCILKNEWTNAFNNLNSLWTHTEKTKNTSNIFGFNKLNFTTVCSKEEIIEIDCYIDLEKECKLYLDNNYHIHISNLEKKHPKSVLSRVVEYLYEQKTENEKNIISYIERTNKNILLENNNKKLKNI